MENSRFTSRDSQPNWVVDIPKEQTGKVLSTIELWAHQNKYMYCGREHEESESCFFIFSYFDSLLYHNWMSVCNTSSGEHSCTGFLVNACSGYNQTATAYRGVLRLEDFLTVMLCALRKKKKKKVVQSWRPTRISRQPPHTSRSAALCSWGGHLSTRPTLIHRLMTATPTW